MNYFYKNKWWAIAVIILIVANTVTLVLLWLVKTGPLSRPPRPFGPPPVHSPAAFVIKQLHFSADQQKQFEVLRRQHQDAVRSVRDSIKDSKEAFFSLLGKNVSDSVVDAAAQRTGMLEKKLDMITFRHFQSVMNICNEEQKQKLSATIGKAISQGGPQEPPPPGMQRRKEGMDEPLPPPQ